MLLSFAQFEREVAGDRICDEIAASKRKGMCMGGHPPLGYDVQDRKLVFNTEEGAKVDSIFSRYAALGSERLLEDRLAAEGTTSKQCRMRWVSSPGHTDAARQPMACWRTACIGARSPTRGRYTQASTQLSSGRRSWIGCMPGGSAGEPGGGAWLAAAAIPRC